MGRPALQRLLADIAKEERGRVYRIDGPASV
jgi:hypothetical protein